MTTPVNPLAAGALAFSLSDDAKRSLMLMAPDEIQLLILANLNGLLGAIANGYSQAGAGIALLGGAVNYVADGDSRTDGTGSPPVSWFNLLCQQPGIIGKNYGVGGKTVAQIVAGYSATGAKALGVSGGHQWSPAVTGRQGIYFVWGATNDLGGGASAATVLAGLQSLYASAHADGYGKVVAFTETARAPAPGSGWETTDETQRVALNASLRGLTLGLSNTPDVLIDTDALFPRYSAFSDGIHLTAAQDVILAQYVREVLAGAPSSYLPFVQLRIAAAQTYSADGTQIVSFAVLQDNLSLFDGVAQNILCPVNGFVQVNVQFLRTTTTVGDVSAVEIWSTPPGGSAAIKWTLNRDIDALAGAVPGVNCSAIVPVVAGELLDFRIGIAGTAGWTILTNAALSQFTVRYVPAR